MWFEEMHSQLDHSDAASERLRVQAIPGTLVTGAVVHRERFGVFIDFGWPVPGLARITTLGDPGHEQWPEVGEEVEMKVLDYIPERQEVIVAPPDFTPRG